MLVMSLVVEPNMADSSVKLRRFEIGCFARSRLMSYSERLVDLIDRVQHSFCRDRRCNDLVHRGQPCLARRVEDLSGSQRRVELDMRARISVAETIDPVRGSRPNTLVHLTEGCSADPIFERSPRRQQNIILVHAHHVGTFATEHADHTKWDILNADCLTDGRAIVK